MECEFSLKFPEFAVPFREILFNKHYQEDYWPTAVDQAVDQITGPFKSQLALHCFDFFVLIYHFLSILL